jgi:hypothetical protein
MLQTAQIALIECGGGGRCGWLSINKIINNLTEIGVTTYDSEAELAQDLLSDSIPHHILLSALRDMFDDVKDVHATAFVHEFMNTNAAAQFVRFNSLECAETQMLINGQRPVYKPEALAKAGVGVRSVQDVRQWMSRLLGSRARSGWFNQTWAMLWNYSTFATRHNLSLALIAQFKCSYFMEFYKSPTPGTQCIFLYNHTNMHWVAAQIERKWSISHIDAMAVIHKLNREDEQ